MIWLLIQYINTCILNNVTTNNLTTKYFMNFLIDFNLPKRLSFSNHLNFLHLVDIDP